jgi:hypothetical protein
MTPQLSANPRQCKPANLLSPQLEKSLAAYAAAAISAGVSLMALASPSEARIVYTPANTPIPVNGGLVPLDLNHDGVADFSFSNWSYVFKCCELTDAFLVQVAPATKTNAVWGRGSFHFSFQGFNGGFASALHRGFSVGANKSYFQNGRHGLVGFSIDNPISSFTTRTYGQWLQTKGRYLGLQFLIDGQVHYGWARLTVSGPQSGGFAVSLTGYAYETIPNKPIITGKTKGPDVITVNERSLGHLARGASQRQR